MMSSLALGSNDTNYKQSTTAVPNFLLHRRPAWWCIIICVQTVSATAETALEKLKWT